MGYGLVFTTGIVVVAMHFDRGRPLALALSISGIGLGTFCYPFLANLLIEAYGWRGALLITSAITLHIVAAGAIIRDPQPAKQVSNNNKMDKKTLEETQRTQESVWASFRYPHYWIVHINTILFCLGFSVFFTHLIAYAESVGISSQDSAALISAHGLAGLGGRIGLGLLASRQQVNIFWLFMASYAISGFSNLLMTVWTSFVGIMVLVVVYSFGIAAFGPLLSEVIYRIIGMENFTYGYGFAMVSMATGSLLGPPCAGTSYWYQCASLE